MSLVFLLAVTCALLMGYSVAQGSTCAVTAGKALLFENQPQLFIGFAVAAGAAGLVCLPLAWAFGARVHLAGGVPLSAAVFVGAVLAGCGALVNDACLFGSLTRISQGELRFALLPVGLAAGFLGAERLGIDRMAKSFVNPLATPSALSLAVVAGFAVLLIVGYVGLRRLEPSPATGGWPLRRAMLVLGFSGALLLMVQPEPTYADAVRHVVIHTHPSMMGVALGFIVAAAMIAGAVAAGLRSHRFHARVPTAKGVARSVLGGAAMALGATLVPGGNDSLLLWSAPSATLSGLVAYAVMSATIVGVMLVGRALRPAASRRPVSPG